MSEKGTPREAFASKNGFEFNPLLEETANAWQVLLNYGFEFICPQLAYVGTVQFVGD